MAKKIKSPSPAHQKSYSILPEQVEIWDGVMDDIRDSLQSTGYQKMIAPVSEQERIFTKKILEYLNISDKNSLFSVKRKSKETLVITPPGPISLLKTTIEQELSDPDTPAKLYQYGMALVDEDNNEATLPRQLHVFKVACIGDPAAVRDAEMILTAYRILEELGITNLVVNINSLGTASCRAQYHEELCARVGKRFAHLCHKYTHDPIRLYSELKSQSTEVNISLPLIIDHLHESASNHFKLVLEFLDTLEVPYVMEPTMRGSIGFNDKTYFEIVSQDNPEIVLIRGGRYDTLFHELGGGEVQGAIGMEIYVDTIVEQIWSHRPTKKTRTKPQVFVASIGQEGQKTALKILSMIQKKGLGVKESFGVQSLKQQLTKAKKTHAPITLIIGRKEAIDGTVILRDRLSENQEVVPIDKLLSTIEQKLHKRS